MSDHEDEAAFKVQDRRRFNPDGTRKAEHAESNDTEEGRKNAPPDRNATGAQNGPRKTQPPFELNFTTFVLSLASSVQIALGIVPNPLTQKVEKHLASAKQTIDILGILQEKTKGNLADDENKLLQQVLYELRVQYLEVKGHEPK